MEKHSAVWKEKYSAMSEISFLLRFDGSEHSGRSSIVTRATAKVPVVRSRLILSGS